MTRTAAQGVQTPAPRLAWLDALRGVGALAVVAEHLLTWTMPWLRPTWCNIGMVGVLVFFLVSGYIIPTSLELRGDVRAFWINRAFRLYPLYLLVIGVVLALSWWLPVRPEVPRDPSSAAAHATMLLDVVGVGGVVNTMWTLSYEMVFYLLVSALFVTGVRGGRGLLAVLFGLAAVVSGLLLADPPLTGTWVAWASAAGFGLGLACVVTGRLRTVAAGGLGLMALALLLLGSRVPWFGAAVVAVMFAGTAIQRWERGRGTLWPVAVTAVAVALAPVWARGADWWWVRPDVWIATIVLAGATFAGGMAMRGWRVPYLLTWLGVISYSLYLLHLPVLGAILRVTGDLRQARPALQIAVAAGFLLALLPACWLTYRFVERPMQRLGHRLARREVTRS
ncbi:acyltransferase family protein [Thermoactinospora rubra]|uniref:acyltransferase family protein n=1 Tax=Thermoactinospora rubra TaxID=1088767 RepID=UPI000A1043A5|nr:acyltransferase [Thermoactinospora rubra]